MQEKHIIKLSGDDYFISPQNTVTVEKRKNQEPFVKHHHDFFELVIVSAGNGLHFWNDMIHPITSGDVLYINDNDIHSYQSVNHLQLYNILYRRDQLHLTKVIEDYLPQKNTPQLERLWRIHHSYQKELFHLIEHLSLESKKNNILSIHLAESLFLQIVILLNRVRQHENDVLPALSHQLDMLFTTLHNSISRNFNLDLFCQQHQFATRTLRRIFKNQTNMTITEYLQKLRMCKAMSLLRNTSYSIQVIAAECGYEDSNYFANAFKKYSQQTPSEYRKLFRSSPLHKLT